MAKPTDPLTSPDALIERNEAAVLSDLQEPPPARTPGDQWRIRTPS